ncbi:MAG: hypothetical protein Q9163_000016 [Psora crenata]
MPRKATGVARAKPAVLRVATPSHRHIEYISPGITIPCPHPLYTLPLKENTRTAGVKIPYRGPDSYRMQQSPLDDATSVNLGLLPRLGRSGLCQGEHPDLSSPTPQETVQLTAAAGQNLAHFVRTHEKALANALQLRRQLPRNAQPRGPDASDAPATRLGGIHSPASQRSTASTIAAAFSWGSLSFSSHNPKPVKLALTPHHLYYLLAQFEELGIHIGPMNVRLENIHADASPANYVSFISQAHRLKRGSRSDHESVHSVSSVHSVMSGLSALWSGSGLGSSNGIAKTEKAHTQYLSDLKYLYSAFTKIPCLRLSPDRKAQLIDGYEEFPFDTAVPLLAFKNVSALEISDVDFRQFYGWDTLAEQLRSLSVKRANLDDPLDLLHSIVLDDMDRRRRRSSKSQPFPVLPWPTTPSARFGDLGRAQSTPSSPVVDERHSHGTSPKTFSGRQNRLDVSPPVHHSRTKSTSPTRPGSALRLDGSNRPVRLGSPKAKRSGSGSSNSSCHSSAPFRTGSSSNLLSMGILPASKWRFLRHLSIADNSLTSLAASSLLPLANTLHSLDISSNLFTEMPDGLASLVALRALNVSNCMIESLHSLSRSPVPAITALNLRANRLASLAGVERLLSLERLDLRENKMQDPTELARLTSIPHVKEIWVARNPFIKSHSNYRLTIFNLFRGTPGYTDDVVVDASGPGYSEKRQLRERAVASEACPVVKPLPVEIFPATSQGPTRVSSGAHPEPGITPPSKKPRRPTVHETQTETTVTSSGRRRGPRRRIVDLARDGSPPILHQLDVGKNIEGIERGTTSIEPNPEILPKMKPALGPPFEGSAVTPPQESTHSETPYSTEPLQEVSSRGHSLANEIQSLNLNGEVYRQKVEALKDEVGSNWLNVLHAHGWATHMAEDSHQPHFTHSVLTKAESPHLGIVSGRRTLS